MTTLPDQTKREEPANLLAEYIAERGLPARVNIPLEVVPKLTIEEQRATIEACEALRAGDQSAGDRLNELWEEIWDRLEMPGLEAALAEAKEKGTIPLEEYMRSRNIPCTPSE